MLLFLLLTSFDAKSQSDSVIAQHCVNFFGNYLLGKSSELKNHRETNRRLHRHRVKAMKVFFSWVSDSNETSIDDYLIKSYFTNYTDLESDSGYDDNFGIIKKCTPIKLEKVNNSLFVKKQKKNTYWMTLYQPKKIGDYYYVKITLSLRYQGYWIYFQVKNIEEPLIYYISTYVK